MSEPICVFCKHFNISAGTGPWSEVTPGEDAEIGCMLYEAPDRWTMSNCEGDDSGESHVDAFRRNIEKAKNCLFYEVEK